MNYGSNYRKQIKVLIIENEFGFKVTENELGFILQKINQDSNYRKLFIVQITENELMLKLQKMIQGSNYRK